MSLLTVIRYTTEVLRGSNTDPLIDDGKDSDFQTVAERYVAQSECGQLFQLTLIYWSSADLLFALISVFHNYSESNNDKKKQVN